MLPESITLTVVYIALLLLLVLSLLHKRKGGLNLPHPKGWPLIGNAMQMTEYGRSDQTLEMWAKQYGPIYSVQVFNMTWVVLSGYDEIYEALVQKSKAFGGRYRWFRFSWLIYGDKDLVLSDPNMPHHVPVRKAMHRTIQPRGDHLNRIETILIDMAQQFVTKVKSYEGKSIDIQDDIYNFVCKIAVAMIIGQNVKDDDNLLVEMKQYDQLTREAISPIAGVELDFFPWLRHFGHPTWKKMKDLSKITVSLADQLWTAGNTSYSPDGEPTCIIHAMAQMFDKQSPFYEPNMTQEHVRAVMFDVIGGSVVTTSSSAYVLVNQLVHHPEVYKRLQQECDKIVGRERPPSVLDRDNMPYAVATILELLRIHSIGPVLIPHKAMEDSSIGEHKIPAGTIVLPLVKNVHHDEKYWGDPLVFRPDRFLDDEGKLLPSGHPNRKRVLTFGAGIRECVGEVFALRRLFIFTVSLVQAFDLEPGDVKVSCHPSDFEEGITVTQKPFTVRLIPRH